MTPEQIFKKWKTEAPLGVTHCLIIEDRLDICWFLGKDFNIAVREYGIQPYRYAKGVSELKQDGEFRKQLLIPFKIVLENK